VHKVKEGKGETVVEGICQLVERKLKQYLAPSKIIVYSRSVAQTVAIEEAIECPIYYCNVDDQAGKARQIKELMEGKH
jgi:hypothetical protein